MLALLILFVFALVTVDGMMNPGAAVSATVAPVADAPSPKADDCFTQSDLVRRALPPEYAPIFDGGNVQIRCSVDGIDVTFHTESLPDSELAQFAPQLEMAVKRALGRSRPIRLFLVVPYHEGMFKPKESLEFDDDRPIAPRSMPKAIAVQSVTIKDVDGCPRCGSTKHNGHGRGRRKCKDCGKTWTAGGGNAS